MALRSKLTGAAAVVAAGVIAIAVVVARPAGDHAVVGLEADFPPGSVSRLDVTVAGALVSDLTGGVGYPELDPARRLQPGEPGLFLVHTGTELRALAPLDTYLGCRLVSVTLDGEGGLAALVPGAEFVDPCHYSQYAIDGTWLHGPSRRDLGAFPVTVDAEGRVRIDPTRFVGGERH